MLDTHIGFLVPELVTTVLGGQNGIVFPFAPVYTAGVIKLIRASVQCQAFSVANGVMDVEVGYQLSDDGVNWPTSTTAPAFFATKVHITQEGVFVGNFEDIAGTLSKRFVRFVVFVKNTAGNTGLGTCLASLRIERRQA